MTEKIQQAIALHQRGDLARAEAIYSQILRQTPNHPDALHMLGVIHAQTGRSDSALALMLKSVQAAPSRGDYLYNLAMAYNDRGRPEEALGIFLKYIAIVPGDSEAIHMVARIFHNRGDLDQAIEYYHRSLALSPKHLATLNSLGLAYSEKNSLEKAVSCYQQALLINPQDPVVLVNLGQTLIQQGNHDQAIERFQRALKIDPDNANACCYLGVALANKKMYPEAAVNFRRAISIQPNHTKAHYNLGIVFLKTKEYAEAEGRLRYVLSTNPEYVQASYSLGLVLRKQGRLDEAEAAFTRELALKPDFPEGHYALGAVLLELSKYAEAASTFRQALTYRPGYREVQVCLAIIAWIQGEFTACEKFCRFDNDDLASPEEDKKFTLPYQIFLNGLCEYAAHHPEQYRHAENLPPLYAIGDSHCLTVAHTTVRHQGIDYLVRPELIIGAKAWHLGNSLRNEFKYSFEQKVASIPCNSTALVMFGEIDCRHDEGIILHYKKTGMDLQESIAKLVTDYLDYIITVLEKREIYPLIVNVPAPRLDNKSLSEEDNRLHVFIIEEFNMVLSEKLLTRHLPLLDVYELSGEGKGLANPEHFLDGYHLLPSIYGEAVQKIRLS